ncbi:MAG: hypothetical protein WC348_01545 [Patescibacteria group bacterium]|jgi:hypothetical protein
MKRKISNKKIIQITVVSMILFTVFPLLSVHAAALSSITDTLTRLKASTVSNHTIKFVQLTGVAAGQKVKVTFPTGFAMGTVDYTDVDLAEGSTNNCSSAVFTDKVLAAAPTGATWGAVVAGQVLTFTSDTDTITADRCVLVEVGTNATSGGAGDQQVTNSTAGNDKLMAIATTTAADAEIDAGTLALSIISEDQVTVTATVNATFTFTISSSSCALGTLSTSNVQTCSVTLTTSTNAVGGYTTTVVGTATGAELVHANLTDNIDNATGIEVNAGSEEFGIGTSDSGVDIVTESDCAGADGGAAADAESIDTVGDNTAASVASAAGPVSGDATTACFAASIAGSTVAGSYTATTTFISTGTF